MMQQHNNHWIGLIEVLNEDKDLDLMEHHKKEFAGLLMNIEQGFLRSSERVVRLDEALVFNPEQVCVSMSLQLEKLGVYDNGQFRLSFIIDAKVITMDDFLDGLSAGIIKSKIEVEDLFPEKKESKVLNTLKSLIGRIK